MTTHSLFICTGCDVCGTATCEGGHGPDLVPSALLNQRDTLLADLDRLREHAAEGGTIPEMRATVTAYETLSNIHDRLTQIIHDLATPPKEEA